ncbi:MAG: radical SAM protein [Phycisphaera sp.]|nr:radical SAM protein [Phycisphaera sp.]
MPPDTLVINEIFHSIQGESTRAGLPCTFVRLTGCHLRCSYCDTEYAFHEGSRLSVDQIVSRVNQLGGDCPLVEVTGGEPLLQPHVHPLMKRLCDAGKNVLLETSGACDISTCDPRVIRIMDLKTPGSGEESRNLWGNLAHLKPQDEVKFVLTSRSDYEWARQKIIEHRLCERVAAVLLGATHETARGLEIAGCPGLPLQDLAQWLLSDQSHHRIPPTVRLQTQLHKLIWPTTARGV